MAAAVSVGAGRDRPLPGTNLDVPQAAVASASAAVWRPASRTWTSTGRRRCVTVAASAGTNLEAP